MKTLNLNPQKVNIMQTLAFMMFKTQMLTIFQVITTTRNRRPFENNAL